MKKCGVCKKELTSKNVFGGLMGLMTRLLDRRRWENFNSCQECRDLYNRGYSIDEIRSEKQ